MPNHMFKKYNDKIIQNNLSFEISGFEWNEIYIFFI